MFSRWNFGAAADSKRFNGLHYDFLTRLWWLCIFCSCIKLITTFPNFLQNSFLLTNVKHWTRQTSFYGLVNSVWLEIAKVADDAIILLHHCALPDFNLDKYNITSIIILLSHILGNSSTTRRQIVDRIRVRNSDFLFPPFQALI